MAYTNPTLLKKEPPLTELTEAIRRGKAITWYRSPLTPAQVKEIHQKSDLQGASQTFGYLGLLLISGSVAFFSASAWPWYATVLCLLAHGTIAAFFINAVHELGHGTVFKTRILNDVFCHVFGFLGWINHEMFQSSHARHHRYTLHPPDDLEVVLPFRIVLWHLIRDGFVNLPSLLFMIRTNWRLARGNFEGPWELTLYPESAPEKRRKPIRISRCILAGHALILIVSALTGQWMLTVLLSLAPFYGNLLFLTCNQTQHVGLQDNVSDFRLCSRTFTLNPFVRFLYWQMNYHIEHHMFAAVPCYNLKKLHGYIRNDLPPTPDGLLGVWREIVAILRIQEKDPSYQHVVTLPPAAPNARGRRPIPL